jgi:CRP-like cAMP-binding protein
VESIDAYVKRHALDRLLSPELLAALTLRRYPAGEHLIRSGQAVDGLFFVVEGRAKVYSQMENGSTLLVRFYAPFDILGDVELFSFDSYVLNVVAIEETACLCLPSSAIKRHAERNTGFLMELCGRLGRKLADFNASAAINLRYPVENRLASYLLAVTGAPGPAAGTADADGPSGAASRSGQCLVTDDLGELADILGTSYRQLSRVLRRFREEGIIGGGRGGIRVLDRGRLEPLARDLYL